MKAFAFATSLIISFSASALPISNPNGIIDPPRGVVKIGAFDPDKKLTKDDLEKSFLENEAYDPASPQAAAILEMMDKVYEAETGLSAFPTGATVDRGDIDPAVLLGQGTQFEGLLQQTADGCVRQSCTVWAVVNKSRQTITIYLNGSPIALPNNRTSTGAPGRGTPNFDKHPDGRIYTKYSSKKFPGGDWKGLGNMPYAVFIRGGFALHGTPSIGSLGSPQSHGCIRLHPYTGKLFNDLVRQYGVSNTWITVQ